MRGLLSLILPFALLSGCSEQVPPPDPLRPALVLTVGNATADGTTVYSGEIRSRVETQLAFRVGGLITGRFVDAGQAVKAGALLARLDPADQSLNAAAAKVQLAQAEADARRYRDLQARNFVSQAALDARETALAAAHAQAGVSSNQQAYTQLHADQEGVIVARLGEVGQVVSAGQPVFTLAQPDKPEVAISIPESRIGELHVGQDADLTLWADDGTTFHGRLRELAPAADAATRTYAARVALLDADARVHLGMTAQVRFAAPSSALRLPLTAIFQQENGKPAVWVVDAQQSVHLRPVEVSAWREDGAVIASGLQNGERVVVAGVHKLTAGERVVPVTRP
jgi:membrane fusion protein, multidrug efflux system